MVRQVKFQAEAGYGYSVFMLVKNERIAQIESQTLIGELGRAMDPWVLKTACLLESLNCFYAPLTYPLISSPVYWSFPTLCLCYTP